jgi:hypothetical protein
LAAGKERKQFVPVGEGAPEKHADASKTNVHFNSYDPDVLALMPAWMTDQLPFVATERGAIDRTLLDFITLLFVRVGSAAAVRACLVELSHAEFYQDMLLYYHVAEYLYDQPQQRQTLVTDMFAPSTGSSRGEVAAGPSSPSSSALNTSQQPASASRPPARKEPVPFGSPSDDMCGPRTGLYVPSSKYLISHYIRQADEDADHHDQYMSSLGCGIMKADHTFNVARRVRGKAGEHVVQAYFALLNEYAQPVGAWWTPSKKLSDLDEQLAALAARFEREGIQANFVVLLSSNVLMYLVNLFYFSCHYRRLRCAMWMTHPSLRLPSNGIFQV